ncbi:MAG: cytochrome c oxidase assembly protein [Methylocystis sp.]|uniref:cytochrome c oxidase assembly protein n=1 Tax=Methylocystis sp. TaxID=1911079 RepID=UPI003D0CD714
MRATPIDNSAAPTKGASVSQSEALIALLVGCAVGLVVFAGPGLGPRASHMASHILLMSAVAPFLAVLWTRFAPAPKLAAGGALAVVATAQIALLYAWHAPGLSGYLEARPAAHFSMHAALLAVALLFWLAILGDPGAGRWRGVAALAITGKLACLLGVLLVFAPRILDPSAPGVSASSETALADQRLAGLLMLAACPLSYVLSGVAIASRWLSDMEANRAAACAQAFHPDGAAGDGHGSR